MLKKILPLLTLLLFYCPCLLGNTDFIDENKINIGYIDTFKISQKSLVVDDVSYPLYDFLDTTYMPLCYLANNIKQIELTSDIIQIDWNTALSPSLTPVMTPTPYVYLDPLNIYIGNIKVYALRNGDHLFIPLSSLSSLYDFSYSSDTIELTPQLYYDMNYLSFDAANIINQSSYLLVTEVTDILWDGESCIENKRTITLEPYSSCAKTDFLVNYPLSITYLTSFVSKINGMPIPVSSILIEDLKNQQLYQTYYQNILKTSKLNASFQPCTVIATLNYATSNLKAEETVTILWAEKKRYYMVQDSTGKEHMLPWGSLKIKGKSGYASYSVTDTDVEDFANIAGLTSDTDYFVWTDKSRHKTYVLKKTENKWTLEKSFICAIGKDKNPTPSGFYKLQYTLPYFGMDHGFRCKYAIVFFRDFMYHSVLFDKEGNYVTKSQLGTDASSGCVRLSVEDSKWLYDNVPMETTVWIH